jgi:hypothetical protein
MGTWRFSFYVSEFIGYSQFSMRGERFHPIMPLGEAVSTT